MLGAIVVAHLVDVAMTPFAETSRSLLFDLARDETEVSRPDLTSTVE